MPLSLAADPLPLRLDNSGTYRVGAGRMRLETIVFAYNQGSTAEQIVSEYPTLVLADVHAIISHYLRHKVDVDAYMAAREEEAAELRLEIESNPRNKELREKLIARRKEWAD